MSVRIIHADVIEGLRQLPDESVHTCVTSPPYFGLRDYQTGRWEGGDAQCAHLPKAMTSDPKNPGSSARNGKPSKEDAEIMLGRCPCGAVKIDSQIGLESTPDEFVTRLVDVFREVRRVLRKDGTLWLNLGDSYCNTNKWGGGGVNTGKQTVTDDGVVPSWAVRRRRNVIPGLKPKDLIGVPWRVALALQADGWYLRSDIIWSKANAMPESIMDRPTRAHEYIFLLTKSERYFYDYEAIKEPAVCDHASGNGYARPEQITKGGRGQSKGWSDIGGTRNKRSVWEINTAPFPGAHFAVFPPEIPTLCIKAGTSQHGCCAACGAPWKRVTEKASINCSNAATAGTKIGGKGHASSQVRENHDVRNGPLSVTKTIGWKPTCACNAGVVPCTVLDPFFGSGTTGLVADRLQRNAIGIELNPNYVAMAQTRLDDDRGSLLDLMDGVA